MVAQSILRFFEIVFGVAMSDGTLAVRLLSLRALFGAAFAFRGGMERSDA
jgi:hypothetical protein